MKRFLISLLLLMPLTGCVYSADAGYGYGVSSVTAYAPPPVYVAPPPIFVAPPPPVYLAPPPYVASTTIIIGGGWHHHHHRHW